MVVDAPASLLAHEGPGNAAVEVTVRGIFAAVIDRFYGFVETPENGEVGSSAFFCDVVVSVASTPCSSHEFNS